MYYNLESHMNFSLDGFAMNTKCITNLKRQNNNDVHVCVSHL